ncbi:MAG: hypothetical protein D6807_07570 [Alphaproteobacteria bacterium]|nr:MAG: hypothetical protein D6807_07570 [Alphaproteobacteria bacterium]
MALPGRFLRQSADDENLPRFFEHVLIDVERIPCPQAKNLPDVLGAPFVFREDHGALFRVQLELSVLIGVGYYEIALHKTVPHKIQNDFKLRIEFFRSILSAIFLFRIAFPETRERFV